MAENTVIMSNQTDIQEWVDGILVNLGVSEQTAASLDKWIIFGGILIIAVAITFILRWGLVRVIRKIVSKTKATWDDIIFDDRVLLRLCNIVTPIVITMLMPVAFSASGSDDDSVAYSLVMKVLDVYLIISILRFFNEVFKAFFAIASRRPSWEGKPIKGLLQTCQVILICIGVILVVAVLLGKSPAMLLTGLGASAAVLMLIFQNSILGLVAGVQLSANNMLKVGDWISMPKQGIDGVVEEVSLTTVKIRAWDNTLQTIPPTLLVNEPFDNWQPMFDRGGRRIKRSLNIDMNSICFVNDDFVAKLKADTQLAEIMKNILPQTLEGGMVTNLDMFMRAVNCYLDKHQRINHNMLAMVRQLQPTQWGLPIEVYCFSANVNWVPYEWLQSEVISYVVALAPKFGLKIYQAPSKID